MEPPDGFRVATGIASELQMKQSGRVAKPFVWHLFDPQSPATTDEPASGHNAVSDAPPDSQPELCIVHELQRAQYVADLITAIRDIIARRARVKSGCEARAAQGLFCAFVFETLSCCDDTYTDDCVKLCRHYVLPSDVGRRIIVRSTNTGTTTNTADAPPTGRRRGVIEEMISPTSVRALMEPNDDDASSSSSPSTEIIQICNTAGEHNNNDDDDCTHRSVRLEEGVRIFLDVLLPCGEVLLPHHVSRSVLQRCLTVLHDTCRHELDVAQRREVAMMIGLEITSAATICRTRLHDEMMKTTATILRCPSSSSLMASVEVVVQPAVAPPLETTTTAGAAAVVQVRCGAHYHELLQSHYDKLRALYIGPQPEFSQRLFCLLQRYWNLSGGDDPHAECGWHGALPPSCMAELQKLFRVDCECFASPFNTSMRKFCSAFEDTDCYFGSRGSFFNFRPLRGAFEVNPPFDHAVMLRMATHIHDLLSRAQSQSPPTNNASQSSSSSLLFVVIIPCSHRGKELKSVGAVTAALRRGEFLLAERTLSASAAAYVDGLQQCAPDTFFIGRFDTRVFVLGNDAARREYMGVDEVSESLERFSEVWKGSSAVEAAPTKRARSSSVEQQ